MDFDKDGKLILTEEEKELFEAAAKFQIEQFNTAKHRVNFIINNKIKNSKEIETTLDMLFEFLDDDEALLLYRKLCRHYWFIDREATRDYIQMYADTYDPDHIKFGNNSRQNQTQINNDKNTINVDNIDKYKNKNDDENER